MAKAGDLEMQARNQTESWKFRQENLIPKIGCVIEKLLQVPCGVVSCTMLTYLAVDRATGIRQTLAKFWSLGHQTLLS